MSRYILVMPRLKRIKSTHGVKCEFTRNALLIIIIIIIIMIIIIIIVVMIMIIII